MVIQPKTWGFLCTTAHPTGCERNVIEQIRATRAQGVRGDGPKCALIIGASSGYGLAARVTAAFGFGAATVGVFSEKPARRSRTASAGWYNTAAFDGCARAAGLQSLSINGDAFSAAARDRTIDLLQRELPGPVDLVIYSMAAASRRLPDSGEMRYTAVKPIGAEFTEKTIDTDNDCIVDVHVGPATDTEIQHTIQVMGGEDWSLWMHALAQAGVLADGAKTIALSYIGPHVTWPIYANGTIGRAKQHLQATATAMQREFSHRGLDARVAIMKSVVTQASAAIPSIPLYLSLIYQVMKDKGLHESAVEQQNRLFRDFLYREDNGPAAVDDQGRLRLDERELRADVQQACEALWAQVNDAELSSLTDYAGYKQDFLQLFGFGRADVDYAADVCSDVPLDCINVA
ncbi:MAG: trans-2-enoyl-CoA reductase family protein [Salinisphaera sp.]|nr:trans-2-enoyl-CoA reductase family protein [Salinisphaera sp.]